MIPEQGQFGAVRQRRYVVADILASQLPSLSISTKETPPQHLLTLNSIQHDILGKSRQVVWKLRPSTRVYKTSDLPEPDGFDSPQHSDAFLGTVCWGIIASVDVEAVQTSFRSGIETEGYELDQVMRAVQMLRVNPLIANNVGLDKKIEASNCQDLLGSRKVSESQMGSMEM